MAGDALMHPMTIGEIAIGVLIAEAVLASLRWGLHWIANYNNRRAVRLWQGHVQ